MVVLRKNDVLIISQSDRIVGYKEFSIIVRSIINSHMILNIIIIIFSHIQSQPQDYDQCFYSEEFHIRQKRRNRQLHSLWSNHLFTFQKIKSTHFIFRYFKWTDNGNCFAMNKNSRNSYVYSTSYNKPTYHQIEKYFHAIFLRYSLFELLFLNWIVIYTYVLSVMYSNYFKNFIICIEFDWNIH